MMGKSSSAFHQWGMDATLFISMPGCVILADWNRLNIFSFWLCPGTPLYIRPDGLIQFPFEARFPYTSLQLWEYSNQGHSYAPGSYSLRWLNLITTA